jgi:hypothetical protein
MAKRPTRSQAGDVSAEQAQPKARRRSGKKELGPESPVAVGAVSEASEPYATGQVQSEEEPRSDPQPMSTEAFSTESEPAEEDIRSRAYQMYIERGGGHGADFEDWVRAEQELRRRENKG